MHVHAVGGGGACRGGAHVPGASVSPCNLY